MDTESRSDLVLPPRNAGVRAPALPAAPALNKTTFNILAGATVAITSGLSLLVLAVTLAGVFGL